MSKPHSFRVRSTVAVGALLLSIAPAVAGDLIVAARDVDVPTCDAPQVLSRIRSDFAYGMARVEGRDLAIAEFGTIRSQGAGVNDPSPVPHRWCYAPVTLTDGRRSTAYWRIDRALGFAAPGYADLTDAVESCVLGHDRWAVHDGLCRTTRRWW
jgi:hypothetical protein